MRIKLSQWYPDQSALLSTYVDVWKLFVRQQTIINWKHTRHGSYLEIVGWELLFEKVKQLGVEYKKIRLWFVRFSFDVPLSPFDTCFCSLGLDGWKSKVRALVFFCIKPPVVLKYPFSSTVFSGQRGNINRNTNGLQIIFSRKTEGKKLTLFETEVYKNLQWRGRSWERFRMLAPFLSE